MSESEPLPTDPGEVPTPIGRSAAFLGTLEAVSRAAALARPVLVVGERGTGKELVAARLHYLSPRWNRPYLKLNCGGLTDTLLESELFGHEAGAFTGAQRRRLGRFELADRGSLFLDEIGNAPQRIQEAILRVVEWGTFERVGGSETRRVDVRLIAATNADLPAEVAAGRFRADLLDRLAFDVITLPPLRERQDDIMLLAEHVAVEMTQELRLAYFPGFTDRAAAVLKGHDWPGNVRELRNVVERAVYRTAAGRKIDEIVIDPFDSPWRPRAVPAPATDDPAGPYDFVAHLAGLERRLLERALDRNRRNRRKTASSLGLSYDQLRHLMRKHGLTQSEADPEQDGGHS